MYLDVITKRLSEEPVEGIEFEPLVHQVPGGFGYEVCSEGRYHVFVLRQVVSVPFGFTVEVWIRRWISLCLIALRHRCWRDGLEVFQQLFPCKMYHNGAYNS